ncbi:MAG: glycosyltransferase family 39 protein [Bryobacteraceae bacterium]
MLVLLPLATGFVLYRIYRRAGLCWRTAVLHSATTFGVLVVLITEVLSLFRAITQINLTVSWAAALLCAALVLHRSVKKSRGIGAAAVTNERASDVPSRLEGALVAGIAVVAFVVGLTALVAPPNTWDAMSYHLPRVIHWSQSRSVAFYPTPEIQQLFQPPWAEYSILHLHVLSMGDRFDNLVQWAAFCGSAIGVSLIASLLGAARRGQVIAAVVCATIPQAVLSASGVKNDCVLSFWLVCLASFLLISRSRRAWIDAVAVGCALGLACLTKGTAYIYAGPLLLAAAVPLGWRVLRARFWHVLAVVAIAVSLNIGQYTRNALLFGAPLGPQTAVAGGCAFANGTYGPRTLFSNAVRSVALHLSTPSAAFNAACQRLTTSLLRSVGVDPNDPETTFCGTTFAIPGFGAIEDTKANTLHLIGALFAAVVMLQGRWWRRNRTAWFYGMAIAVSFLLFCLLLRWQPWHTRLHLPFFVLSSPLVGMALASVLPTVASFLTGMFLLLVTLPLLFGNELRPLIIPGRLFAGVLVNGGRTDFYFAGRQEFQRSYTAAARSILESDCRDVGLNYYGDNQIYPLLVLLGAHRGEVRTSAVDVANISAPYAEPVSQGVRPCAVVCMSCTTSDKFLQHGEPGWRVTRFQDIVVFSDLSRPAGGGHGGLRSPVRVGLSVRPHETSGDLTVTIGGRRAADVTLVEVLVNSTFTGEHGCWIQCNPSQNTLTLVNDKGDGAVGRARPGIGQALRNSQCALDPAQSSVRQTSGDLTISLRLSLAPAFTTPKAMFVSPPADTGRQGGWQTAGVWTVANR